MTEVQKFCDWVEDQVANQGLLQVSGVHLDKGGSALDILESKRYEYCFHQKVLEGKELLEAPTLEQIAAEMNYINEEIASGRSKPLVFNDSSHPKPSGEPSELTKQILRDLSE